MARSGSRGRRTSYVRDNSGRFASTPGGGPPKRSTPASRRAARAKVTGGTLGARGSLRRSRTKLAGKNPADRSLRGSLSLRAQRGAVTRGANRLGKVRAASTVRMAGKGPAGVIRGGRKVAAKPVASAQPKLAAAKRIGSPRPSGTLAKSRNLKPGAIAARKAKAAASGARGARATTNYNRAQKAALEAQQRVNRRRSPKNLAALARADKSLKTAARAYRILVGLGGEKMAVARKPSPKGAGPRTKAARPAGTVVKPRGLEPGAIAGRKAKSPNATARTQKQRIAQYERVAAKLKKQINKAEYNLNTPPGPQGFSREREISRAQRLSALRKRERKAGKWLLSALGVKP